MKTRKLTLWLYAIYLLSLFLPWFTYNGAMMGYCRGIHFMRWMAVPLVILGVCLVQQAWNIAMGVLSEVCLTLSLAVLILAFGLWEQVYNIREGFNWSTGFHTMQPGYWISAMLFLTLLILVQIRIFVKGRQ